MVLVTVVVAGVFLAGVVLPHVVDDEEFPIALSCVCGEELCMEWTDDLDLQTKSEMSAYSSKKYLHGENLPAVRP